MPENDYLAALAAAAPEPSQAVEEAGKETASAPPPSALSPVPSSQPLPTQASDWAPTSQAVLEVAHPVATAYAEACDGRGLGVHPALVRALAAIPAALCVPVGGAAPPPCPPYGTALALDLPGPSGGDHEDGGQAGAVFVALFGR